MNMIGRISMIHMMEKEETAEAAHRFAAIFLSCTSCLSYLIMFTAAETEFSVKKSYG